jgi:hypothetical protein
MIFNFHDRNLDETCSTRDLRFSLHNTRCFDFLLICMRGENTIHSYNLLCNSIIYYGFSILLKRNNSWYKQHK